MKNIYLEKMRACRNIADKTERKVAATKVMIAAAKDESITDRQFANICEEKKRVCAD